MKEPRNIEPQVIDITEPKPNLPLFKDIPYDGFFVSYEDEFCQRLADTLHYNVIATKIGRRCVRKQVGSCETPIIRLINLQFVF